MNHFDPGTVRVKPILSPTPFSGLTHQQSCRVGYATTVFGWGTLLAEHIPSAIPGLVY
jgi:hypothetical protein